MFWVVAWDTRHVSSHLAVASAIVSTRHSLWHVCAGVIQSICQTSPYWYFSHSPPNQKGFNCLSCLIATCFTIMVNLFNSVHGQAHASMMHLYAHLYVASVLWWHEVSLTRGEFVAFFFSYWPLWSGLNNHQSTLPNLQKLFKHNSSDTDQQLSLTESSSKHLLLKIIIIIISKIKKISSLKAVTLFKGNMSNALTVLQFLIIFLNHFRKNFQNSFD